MQCLYCTFLSLFCTFLSLFSTFGTFSPLRIKKYLFYPCMHFLENKDMSCVTRYKSNWDSDFTGVSSSEAPPYLLLWHFIENKNSKRTLFSRISKMLKTKQAILFKKYFSFFLGKSSSFEKVAQKCFKTLFKENLTIYNDKWGLRKFFLDCPSSFLCSIFS